MNIKILKKEEYVPSTVTMVSNFNRSINPTDMAKFLPVVHLFSKKTGNRIKLDSGTRTSIRYYGYENIIISVCYKKIRRGMRTGAMNNMVSLDIQYGGKNIHVKISSTTITSVGTSGYEFGVKVFNLMLEHLNKLNDNIKYMKNLEKEEIEKNLKWVLTNCTNENENLEEFENFIKKIKTSQIDKKFCKNCALYLDDFEKNDTDGYKAKIIEFVEKASYFDGKLECQKPSIFNSVYHINIFNNNSKTRIPLHRLAPYLAEKSFIVEFHNWTSEGVNVCFDIEEVKEGVHHQEKEYKHRFTIHERGTMRQCSPTFKEESYRYYLGMIKQIEQFYKDYNDTDNYKEYIEYETKVQEGVKV